MTAGTAATTAASRSLGAGRFWALFLGLLVVAGVPAKPKGWMCKCAVKLAFAGDRATCAACGAAYVMEGGVVREAEGK